MQVLPDNYIVNRKKFVMKKRNIGIDILRVVCMYLVVNLHIIGVGGVLMDVPEKTVLYKVYTCIYGLAFSAVNCYALISGYVMSGQSYKNIRKHFLRIIPLWVQVVTYSVLFSVVECFLSNLDMNYAIKTIGFSLFPALTKKYWYFTAYIILYFI